MLRREASVGSESRCDEERQQEQEEERVLVDELRLLLEDEYAVLWDCVAENLANAGRLLTKEGFGRDTASFFNERRVLAGWLSLSLSL